MSNTSSVFTFSIVIVRVEPDARGFHPFYQNPRHIPNPLTPTPYPQPLTPHPYPLLPYPYPNPHPSSRLDPIGLSSPAARSGNLPTVELLLESGCDVDKRNLFYTTPLHLACQNDRVDVVRHLLKAGAAPDAPDEAGITPSQLTKRDDIVKDLEAAVEAAVRKRDELPPPPAA